MTMAKPLAKNRRQRHRKESSKSETNAYVVRRTLIHILIISAVGFLIYSNTFTAPFIFDDESYIANNPAIKDFQYFKNPLRIHSATIIGANFRYALITRPLGYFTFALNYKMHGLDVAGYHVFNLFIHIFNALLVYALVLLTFRTPYFLNPHGRRSYLNNPQHYTYIAFFAALMFISHPVQTQAVTYITQRFASLAAFFYLLSLVVYIKSRLSESGTGKWGFYSVALLAAISAMMVKEISFTLPITIALYEFMFLDGTLKKRILYLIPFSLTMLIIPLALLAAKGKITDIGSIDETIRVFAPMSRWDYLATQFRVIVTYMRLLFFPVNQNLDYDFPIFHSFFNPSVLLSFIFLLLIFLFGVYLFYRSEDIHSEDRHELKVISFGILWFFITLSVESSIIPLSNVIFEHRLYLPSVGFFISAITSIVWVKRRLKPSLSMVDKTILPLLAVVALVLSIASYARNGVWQNEERLLEDVVKKSPAKARPHNNLGVFYETQGRFKEAEREFKNAIRVKQVFAEAHNNLGMLYGKQGRFDEAIREFQATIEMRPDYARAHDNLGVLFDKQGRSEDAIREFQTVVKMSPDYAEGHDNLGVLYDRQGRFEDAIKEFQAAIELKPDLAEPHNNLGVVYGKRGLLKDAIREFRVAVRLRPDYAEAHNNLGIAYINQDFIKEARESFQTALAIDPKHPGARRNLEYILKSKK